MNIDRILDYATALGQIEGVVDLSTRGFISDQKALTRIREIIAEIEAKKAGAAS